MRREDAITPCKSVRLHCCNGSIGLICSFLGSNVIENKKVRSGGGFRLFPDQFVVELLEMQLI